MNKQFQQLVWIQLNCGKIIWFTFWDTAGQRNFSKIVIGYMNNNIISKNCIVLGFDVSKKDSLLSIKEFW